MASCRYAIAELGSFLSRASSACVRAAVNLLGPPKRRAGKPGNRTTSTAQDARAAAFGLKTRRGSFRADSRSVTSSSAAGKTGGSGWGHSKGRRVGTAAAGLTASIGPAGTIAGGGAMRIGRRQRGHSTVAPAAEAGTPLRVWHPGQVIIGTGGRLRVGGACGRGYHPRARPARGSTSAATGRCPPADRAFQGGTRQAPDNHARQAPDNHDCGAGGEGAPAGGSTVRPGDRFPAAGAAVESARAAGRADPDPRECGRLTRRRLALGRAVHVPQVDRPVAARGRG